MLRSEMEKLGLVQDFSMVVEINAAAPVLRKPSEVEGLAQRIAQFASVFAPTLGADPARYIAAPELAARGLAEVSGVTINQQRPGSPREAPALVSPCVLGAVDGAIRDAIEEKEKSLPDYKAAQAFDEVWLLLVTGESLAQTTDAVIVEPFRFPSAFDAVYLLDLQADQLLRVDDGVEK
ncbi:hypothetical protein F0U61_38105 [Archangium violaceum]|uniref:hypothetical protein n=1 Tax=Archangium violaceum TaxID=83451 RepID=UPI002B29C97A|nr:hypothetical protein F0U61_38105 [Archangium violaceum]